MRFVILGLVTSGLGLGACGQSTDKHGSSVPEPPAASAPAASVPAASAESSIADALAHPDRLASDREIDARRKPDQVLAFFDIKPGMTVLDMFSGTGYYSELVSFVVGPEGTVHAHNNTPYLKWVSEPLAKRYTAGRLANVKRFTAENNELSLPPDTFDATLMILTYHDVYHVHPKSGWDQIDGPKMMAEIFRSMKSGAVLGVVDHVAVPGAPPETGETLHRIDPALAKQEIIAAGFVFEAESEASRNPADDLTAPALSKKVRGKTDRFVFRFRKP